MSWASKAIAPAVALMGAIAIAAWLPDGLTNGVRLLGFSTATVISLTAIAGLSLAGTIVWRARSPRPARWTAVALAVYAVVALAHAALTHVPFTQILIGAALPFALRGAMLAGLIMLPVALIAAVMRRHVAPRRRPSAEIA